MARHCLPHTEEPEGQVMQLVLVVIWLNMHGLRHWPKNGWPRGPSVLEGQRRQNWVPAEAWSREGVTGGRLPARAHASERACNSIGCS